MIPYARDLPVDASDELIASTEAHVRAEMSARAAADDDPETNADDVEVSVERLADKVRVVGTLDAEPDAPYLKPDYDAFAGVPAHLLAQVYDDGEA
ncbi:hypothetical protein [Lentzea cavernae]|uniref:Uncharacterized protein n=1 Tax=Lentzea cavernae TaxID=2020703 RepID=A0ABQ3MX73_9PSEU|nr:hypothetical protein [Lentzea cavernae]GHH57698.1 hypothetical protein GCM10017774_77680 [Lentzea cavernae]